MSGRPKTVVLEPEEIRGALEEPTTTIIDSIVACLGEAPPDLAQDLIVNGIHLVGGGGLLRGLVERLTIETEVQVKLVDLPLECVVLGAGRCIESYDALRVMFME
jgi:rod shape-determining protein MreB